MAALTSVTVRCPVGCGEPIDVPASMKSVPPLGPTRTWRVAIDTTRIGDAVRAHLETAHDE